MSKFSAVDSSYSDYSMHDPQMTEDCICYDTEGSDTDVRHGQIFQFSAVKTDRNLQVLHEEDILIRRLPYVIPAPEALAVTGLDIHTLDSQARLVEFDAAEKIHKFLQNGYNNNRIFLAFNGIKYDDEMLRTTFFRNLLNPYVMSGKNNTRIDVLNLVKMVSVCSPSTLHFPLHQDGRKIFRLESLAPANGISLQAHDGLEDAKATVDIARIVKEADPWVWDIAKNVGQSKKVEVFCERAIREKRLAWHFEYFSEPDLAPVAIIGDDGRGRYILVDLRKDYLSIDPSEFSNIDNIEWRKEHGIRIVSKSSAPYFIPSSFVHKFGVHETSDDYAEALQAVHTDSYRLTELTRASREIKFNNDNQVTSEQNLYGSFVKDRDNMLMRRFRQTQSWEERSKIQFEDPRIRDFASRILRMTADPSFDLFSSPTPVKEFMLDNDVFDRPFAGLDAAWVTLDKCHPEADDAWLEWAYKTYSWTPPNPTHAL